MCGIIFFFNDTATTEIYTLSLHDALPIWRLRQKQGSTLQASSPRLQAGSLRAAWFQPNGTPREKADRKSTRLNSSHANISYAVFCLKKKNSHTSAIHSLQFLR